MKLLINVFKHQSNGTEIRIAAPPFDPQNTIGLNGDGSISVDLFQDRIDLLRDDLELAENEWFDSIQWSRSLEDLAADFVDNFRRHGELAVDVAYRDDVYALATILERTAAMIRSVEFFDATAWDAQFGPAVATPLGVQIKAWKPYPTKGEGPQHGNETTNGPPATQ